MPKSITFFMLCFALVAPAFAERDVRKHFDDAVAPLLIKHCLECHAGPDPKGGLDLSTAKSAVAGGESGKAIVAGAIQESLLWERVASNEMPPQRPLTDADKQVLRSRIESGATWGSEALDPFRFTTGKRAGYDWWSLQPIADPPLPVVAATRTAENALDHFIFARQESQGVTGAAIAARRELVRRLSFDLLGLPPTDTAVDAFAVDERPDAYERLTDRLLASPHYGVRWGRHWLDVARFGESQGFERDKIRENSWPFRDWVIDALNRDLPYDAFVRRQIAGDVLAGADASAVVATGFLVAGPYDEVGQSQQSAAMKAVVRQDELEDIASVVGQTFLGLTVNCARCHDHKFDPIRQREYYQLTAALDGVRHGSRQVVLDRDGRVALLRRQIDDAQQQIRRLEQAARERVLAARDDSADSLAPPVPIACWTFEEGLEDSLGQLHGRASGQARVVDGRLVVDGQGAFVTTAPLATDLREKTLEAWVRLRDLKQRGGGVFSVEATKGGMFDAIVFGEQEPLRWMAGSDSFRRTQSFSGPAEAQARQQFVHVAIAYHRDGTIVGYRDGKPYGQPYKSTGPVTFAAGKSHVLFGLRHRPAGDNRQLAGEIEAAQLYDRALSATEVAQSAAAARAGVSLEQLLAVMSADERQRRDQWKARVTALTKSLPAAVSVYAVTPRPATVGRLLVRGNPAVLGETVTPRGIASLVGLSADLGLAPDAADAQRRRQLARWITDRQSPLFARVIVNRLWHHHFGTGIVETPNDFGFNGGRPSHPALIDHLAEEIARRDWSLKSVHRLIVTSATYRQSSRSIASSARQDADNRLLWRKTPQRLDAESLRDTMLSVAGQLNSQMSGPGFRDFDTFTSNTQFYVMKDPIGPAFHRRTVYRTWIRSGRNRFLDVFDCPDPSTKTPQRAVTVTPLQSLALMNNSFVLRMSGHLAERLRLEAGADVAAQVHHAYRLAFQREPGDVEVQEAVAFVAEQGLPELCRVIFNSNEFLYVD